MLYANAATEVLLKGHDLHDGHVVSLALRSIRSYVGIEGSVVALDSSGDRIETYEVMNYVLGADDVMRSVAVGVYNVTLHKYEAYEQAVVWPGSSMEVPTTGLIAAAGCRSILYLKNN